MGKRIFLDEHKKWIKENAIGKRNEELTDLFNKRFNMNINVKQIKKFKNAHHISSGFKSCNLPVGSERIVHGYIMVKTAEPNIWIDKQRLIYENVYGKIPLGHRVIFADNNKNNFDIDNLILVTDTQALIMNKNNLRFIDSDLTKTGVIIAKLIDEINKIKY